MPDPAGEQVTLGRVGGAWGVRGWVRVHSDCRPPESIFSYPDWWIGEQRFALREGKAQGSSLVASLEGVDSREAAATLKGQYIAVPLSELPAPPAGEYYWRDLVGLSVVTADGTGLGVIERMVETGANDVMVVRGDRERWLPWIPDVVRHVDLEARRIEVDWDPEF
ncbi:MAG: ribosome maturation factor RimM [Gammaproteobacteria bacterium]|nr:ribosome maturation factor RimM [Gammaproteobacteria bacterium]